MQWKLHCTYVCRCLLFTWLDVMAWLAWLEAKLPRIRKFFSSNRKPATADFLPSKLLQRKDKIYCNLVVTWCRGKYIRMRGPFLAIPGEHCLPEDQDEGILHRHAHFEQRLSRGNVKHITHLIMWHQLILNIMWVEMLPAQLWGDPERCWEASRRADQMFLWP